MILVLAVNFLVGNGIGCKSCEAEIGGGASTVSKAGAGHEGLNDVYPSRRQFDPTVLTLDYWVLTTFLVPPLPARHRPRLTQLPLRPYCHGLHRD